ncbi:MAG: Minf_1886 family protein [Isosphaeraceae bacterium]
MSLRDELAGVLARDPRYTIHAYAFVFEALEHTKSLKNQPRTRPHPRRAKGADLTHHVTGRDLCEGARELALKQYGLMTLAVLAQWGIRSTSDLGNLVYNLIASGDLEKTPTDSRADFEGVYDFDTVFRQNYVWTLDDVA